MFERRAAAHANIIQIRDANHFQNVLKEAGSKLVAVDFSATWLGFLNGFVIVK